MAEPATRTPPGDDAPPFDPVAVDRAYLHERARRRARTERSRARRRAGLRFWLVVIVLIAVSVFITLTIWRVWGAPGPASRPLRGLPAAPSASRRQATTDATSIGGVLPPRPRAARPHPEQTI